MNSHLARGNGRMHVKRDEGAGGSEGIILDLTLVGDGMYSAIYTAPVTVGQANQTLQVQVDTGSSDLWIASKSCSSAPCTNNKPKLYDPSSSTNAPATFDISYLSGEVDGPIVWDKFVLGGYEIDSQALAAASTVVNETLGPQFSGILGLALPKDSVIAKDIPPVTDSVPDGATVTSNLFGITPASEAPAQFFYSLLLGRPGSSRIPSVLGIGRHPSSALLPEGPTIEPADVAYSSLLSESDGIHFWKVELRALTVYVNGTAKKVNIGRSVTGNIFPEAILDSGVPYIISTPAIANGVWGALGIGPATDGNYYVPCTTPLNMTVTLDDRSEIPLHPLDLSAVSLTDTSNPMCVGLVQQSSSLENALGLGDIILGVPFLRSVYTVMTYESVSSGGIVGNGKRAVKRDDIEPRLGLLNLTNPATALDEFNTVRVLNQPLDGNNSNKSPNSPGHGLPVGLDVLFGLIGFAVLCAVLFVARWLYMRRLLKASTASLVQDQREDGKDAFVLTEYHGIPPFRSHSAIPSEDTQRTLHDPFSRLDAKYDSIISAHTKVGSDGEDEFGYRQKKIADGEYRESRTIGDSNWDSHTSWIDAYPEHLPALHGEWRPPTHERSYSSSSTQSNAPSAPLLNSLDPLEREVDEFGVGLGMAGVGTARRGSVLDDDLTLDMRHSRIGSDSSSSSISPQSSRPRPRPRPGRLPSGPRPSSTMSRVINADELS
ncbi:acid protease [Phellopilus nigrolimitatus]|nr:acid protease [Phellopilus nigrolimitatus]